MSEFNSKQKQEIYDIARIVADAKIKNIKEEGFCCVYAVILLVSLYSFAWIGPLMNWLDK